MRKQHFIKFLGAVLATSVLAACGGGDGVDFTGGSGGSGAGSGGGGTTTPTATPAHVSIATNNSTINGGSVPNATITATVTDANNLTVTGATVALKVDKGALAVSSTKTDANGNVVATLTQGSAKSGDTITVTATVGSLTPATVKVAVTSPSVYALGTVANDGTFTPGVIAIGVGNGTLSAGGTTGLAVQIVDTANSNALYQGAATVTFSSPCKSAGTSQITSPVSITTGGTINSTYVAQGCGPTDKITANAVVGSTTLAAATGTVTIASPTLGGLKFTSATPNVIGLAGTGQNTASIVAFEVTDSHGNPLSGTTVNFTLAANTGGITLTNTSAVSDANGLVQTTVNAGTVHTTVVVNAAVAGTSKATQSIGPVISLAIPTQNGFSLSATTLNIEAAGVDGVTTTITARLSDRYGNGVPDGTAVNFTAECGHVDASCPTVNSTCSVVFTSQSPRTTDLYAQQGNMNSQSNADQYALGNDDHRCSVMASTAGEESFNDANGNGLYDTGEFFVAKPEAFLDANENGVFNKGSTTTPSNDTFLDFNVDAVWNSPVSTQFVGLLCNTGSNANPVAGACSGGNSLNVFQNIPIVLASGSARLSPAVDLPQKNASVASAPLSFSDVSFSSVAGKTVTIPVLATDTVGQTLPAGTIVTLTSTLGSVSGPASYTISNTDGNTVFTDSTTGVTYPLSLLNFTKFIFKLAVPTTATANGTVTISAKSPGGITTFTTFDITLP